MYTSYSSNKCELQAARLGRGEVFQRWLICFVDGDGRWYFHPKCFCDLYGYTDVDIVIDWLHLVDIKWEFYKGIVKKNDVSWFCELIWKRY